MAYKFTLPGRTVMGSDALNESEAILKGFVKKALFVPGKMLPDRVRYKS